MLLTSPAEMLNMELGPVRAISRAAAVAHISLLEAFPGKATCFTSSREAPHTNRWQERTINSP
jgi:hypothetical protein